MDTTQIQFAIERKSYFQRQYAVNAKQKNSKPRHVKLSKVDNFNWRELDTLTYMDETEERNCCYCGEPFYAAFDSPDIFCGYCEKLSWSERMMAHTWAMDIMENCK